MAVVTRSVWSTPAEPEQLQPFRIRGGTRGCLLIHGFAGTPPEMRGVGEFLAARGYDVIGPLLAGHGLTPQAMALTRWPDWVRSAEGALASLRRDCRDVFVAGQSLGGTLALHLAATHPDVKGVITLGALTSPSFFRDWRITWIRGIKYVVRWHVPPDDCDLGDPSAMRLLHSYARRPTGRRQRDRRGCCRRGRPHGRRALERPARWRRVPAGRVRSAKNGHRDQRQRRGATGRQHRPVSVRGTDSRIRLAGGDGPRPGRCLARRAR